MGRGVTPWVGSGLLGGEGFGRMVVTGYGEGKCLGSEAKPCVGRGLLGEEGVTL